MEKNLHLFKWKNDFNLKLGEKNRGISKEEVMEKYKELVQDILLKK